MQKNLDSLLNSDKINIGLYYHIYHVKCLFLGVGDSPMTLHLSFDIHYVASILISEFIVFRAPESCQN